MSTFYNLLMAQKRDKEPIWLEYLESDGRQVIRTDFKPNTITSGINITFQFLKFANIFPFIFGARIGAEQTTFCGFVDQRGGTIKIDCDIRSIVSAPIDLITKHTLTFNNMKYNLDGNTGSVTGIKSYNVNIPLGLFNCNQDYALPPTSPLRIYSCQLYDENKLVHNFRPCLNPYTLKPAMYDTVSKKYYYNSGEGEFKYELNFTKLDYIEGGGRQYIDTKVKPNVAKTTLCSKFIVNNQIDTYAGLFGARSNVGIWNIFSIKSNNMYSLRLALNKSIEIPIEIGTWNSIIMNAKQTILNGQATPIQDVPDVTLDQSILLMTFFDGLAGDIPRNPCVMGGIKDTTIDENNILQRDYIPCRMNNGDIGMWDFITGQFYGNAGEGKFKGYLNGYQVGTLGVQEGQYIQTNYISNKDTAIECGFTISKLSPSFTCLIGRDNAEIRDKDIRFFMNKDSIFYALGHYRTSTSETPTGHIIRIKPNEYYTFGLSKDRVFYNDADLPVAEPVAFSGQPTLLFSDMKSASFTFDGISAYFKIKDNDEYHYLVPARKGSFIGMIDTLTGKKYYNAGTGEFTFNE